VGTRRTRAVTVVGAVLAVGLVAAGLVVALPGGTGTRVGLLLAALDHHLELPGERVHLPDHERESGDCGER